MSEYLGWRNWDTWNSYTWLSSDEAAYKGAYRSRNNLKEWFTMWFGPVDGIDLEEVDWQELRAALVEDDDE